MDTGPAGAHSSGKRSTVDFRADWYPSCSHSRCQLLAGASSHGNRSTADLSSAGSRFSGKWITADSRAGMVSAESLCPRMSYRKTPPSSWRWFWLEQSIVEIIWEKSQTGVLYWRFFGLQCEIWSLTWELSTVSDNRWSCGQTIFQGNRANKTGKMSCLLDHNIVLEILDHEQIPNKFDTEISGGDIAFSVLFTWGANLSQLRLCVFTGSMHWEIGLPVYAYTRNSWDVISPVIHGESKSQATWSSSDHVRLLHTSSTIDTQS